MFFFFFFFTDLFKSLFEYQLLIAHTISVFAFENPCQFLTKFYITLSVFLVRKSFAVVL